MNVKINRSTHNRDLQVYTYLINIYLLSTCNVQDFPHDSDSKKSACNVRPGFDPWVGKIPWRREWQPTSVFLLGEFPGTEEPCGLQFMGSQSQT